VQHHLRQYRQGPGRRRLGRLGADRRNGHPPVAEAFRKPVIAIINTHYHGDHWLGNDAFAAAYKGLPIYAHPGTIKDIQGVQGNMWRTLMEQWTNQATMGTRVVPPSLPLEHGNELSSAMSRCACTITARRTPRPTSVSKSSRTN
jgi:glyoxylase-like metal-dependent hydrolase (beta-lactamase superfamily II)